MLLGFNYFMRERKKKAVKSRKAKKQWSREKQRSREAGTAKSKSNTKRRKKKLNKPALVKKKHAHFLQKKIQKRLAQLRS